MSTEKSEKTGLEMAIDETVSIEKALGKLERNLSGLNITLILKKGVDLSETLRPLGEKLKETRDVDNEVYMKLVRMLDELGNRNEDEEA